MEKGMPLPVSKRIFSDLERKDSTKGWQKIGIYNGIKCVEGSLCSLQIDSYYIPSFFFFFFFLRNLYQASESFSSLFPDFLLCVHFLDRPVCDKLIEPTQSEVWLFIPRLMRLRLNWHFRFVFNSVHMIFQFYLEIFFFNF